MSINNNESFTEKKFGFQPVESPNLNKIFKSKGIDDLDDKKEYLISLGIEPHFASQLNSMFEEIKASTSEIILHTPEIIASNNRVDEELNLSQETKTNLAIMKAS